MFVRIALFYFGILLYDNLTITSVSGIRKYTKQDLIKLREEVREMFNHAYTGYVKYAYPYDELRPLTCDGVDTWGSYSLTLIDALDTLAVMGNYSEFRRVVDIITAKANFDANINVSVFETNIRIVGGLLSAHLFSQRAGIDVEPGWPCNGPLLRLAEDVAQRLLPAFDTKTGMPYGTVNLRYGVPNGETTVTCTAGVGTFILEFATLSRLTGDPIYEEVAMNALYVLHDHRSPIGLFGNHIDVKTGKWIARDSGIGAGVDSYFEYLVKGSILLHRPELMAMFNEARKPIDKYLKKNNWYVWASMHKGQVTIPVFQSLEAYWPGVLALIGDIDSALRSMHNYNSVWKQYGFTPEFYNIAQGQASTNRESYPLRPELAESAMYLYRATGDPFMLDIGLNILRSIQHSAKTSCGYATIKDARDHTQENRMESFFLAETTKYLYLLFDPDNFIHNTGQHGLVHVLPSGKQCILDSGGYIFNTEAHPIDPGALSCCSDWSQESYSMENKFNFKGDSLKAHRRLRYHSSEESSEDVITEDSLETTEDNQNSNIVKGTAELIGENWQNIQENPTTSTVPSSSNIKISEHEKNLEGSNRDPNQVEVDKELLDRVDNFNKFVNMIKTHHKHIISALQKLSSVPGFQKSDGYTSNDNNKELGSTNTLSLNDNNNMSITKEHEPTFHQSRNGLTTENNSPHPSIETEWDTNNLSYRSENVLEVDGESSSGKSELITLPEYVKQLVNVQPPKIKFDPQLLLQKIRSSRKITRNEKWENQYELLSCKAQPFLIRLTIAGEFLDEK